MTLTLPIDPVRTRLSFHSRQDPVLFVVSRFRTSTVTRVGFGLIETRYTRLSNKVLLTTTVLWFGW